jgi:uncharacterized repeat protein (TIGR01451 family)
MLALGLVGVALGGAYAQAAAVKKSPASGLPIPTVLLVDDDDNAPDMQPVYEQLLVSLGYTFTVWDTDNSDSEPSASYLQNFDAVIWFTGAEFGGSAGPGAPSELELQTWLDTTGACFFMSSQDYFFDRAMQGMPTPFMTNYLGVAAAQSDVLQEVVTGTHTYGGLGPFYMMNTFPFANFSDVFTPTLLAEEVFQGDKTAYGGSGELLDRAGRLLPTEVLTATESASRAAAVSLHDETHGWQTTWLGFPLEALPTLVDQRSTLTRFLSNCFVTDLQTFNTVSDPVVNVGEAFSYTLRTLNHGPYQTNDVTLRDFIPPSFEVGDIQTFSAAICSQGTTIGLTCVFSELSIGEVVSVTFAVTPTQPGEFTNFAFSTNFSQDLTPANNSTSALVRVLDPEDTQVYLDKVVPNAVNRDDSGVIQVFGANFQPTTQLFLNDIPIPFTLDAENPDALLSFTLPSSFETGEYSLIANNSLDNKDILFKSLVVYDPDALDIDNVLPHMGPNDHPVLLNIIGDGFAPGMTGKLIDSTNPQNYYLLETPNFVSEHLVRALVPYGIPAGIYDVRLYNPVNISATLPMAYESLDWIIADDVGALDFDLYTIPASPREGDEVTVGLTVRRRTGEAAPFIGGPVSVEVNLGVSGEGNAPTISLSSTGVISPNSSISVTLPWTPALAGSYHLTVDVSSLELGEDSIPANDQVERHVVVLPASEDPDPPVIESVTVNGGVLITNLPSVVLNTLAADTGSGLSHIFYIDYIFDRNLGDWYPANQTGWLPYAEASGDFAWVLDPTPGAHYVQAWVSDAAGNISQPKSALINLITPKNFVAHDGGQVYRLPLFPATLLSINLTSLTGDADMYAWAPDGTLAAAAFSSNPFEQLSLLGGINPPGLYQIEVYGFETTSYWFEVNVTGAGFTLPEVPEDVFGHVKGGDRALLTVDENPGADMSIPPAPGVEVHVFLPLIVR